MKTELARFRRATPISLSLFILFAGCSSPNPGSNTTSHSTNPGLQRSNVPRVMIEGRNTYFMVDLEKLTSSRPGETALTPAKAEKLAKEWLSRKARRTGANPKASDVLTLPAVPGSRYYLISLGTTATRVDLQEVLVLMDGTIVESELK